MKIIAKHSGMALEAVNNNVEQHPVSDSAAQLFTVQSLSNGKKKIIAGSKCLSAGPSGVLAVDCADVADQQFTVTDQADGYVEIRSSSGQCLDVAYNDSVEGRRLGQYQCNFSANQRFKLLTVSPPPPEDPPVDPPPQSCDITNLTLDQLATRLRAIADESPPSSPTPVLQVLGMTKTNLMKSQATNDAVVGDLTGTSQGSILSITSNAAMRLDGNTVKVVGTPAAGTYTINVTETLSGATGSPKQSSFDILVCGSLSEGGGGGGEVIPTNPLEGLTLLWEEDFADMPTTADWSFGAKPGNWDNGQYGKAWFAPLEGFEGHVPYSVTPEGHLRIRAKHKPGSAYPTYISGNIATVRYNAGPPQSRDIMHGMRKGYFECRMKAPAVKGFWPAFWLLSDDAILNQQGHSVEIDIAELYMQWPTAYHVAMHGWSAGTHSPDTVIGNPDGGGSIPNLAADFHTFGARVFNDVVTWYFDRVEVYRYPLPQSFSQEQFWDLVKLAVSDHEQEVVPPQFVDLLVDYVRFYG